MSRTQRPRRWRPSALSLSICLIALASSGVGIYPAAAAWLNSYQQSLVIMSTTEQLDELDPSAAQQLKMARAYNRALVAGVALRPGASVPVGYGAGAGGFTYRDVLNANGEGVMGRVTIDSIDVDLPIYHGTDEETLKLGAGHLEGSHLPVGGAGTRSVITAHRGLATATLFTHLDRVDRGDRFTVSVLGDVRTYEVRNIKVIDPDDTDTLRAVAGRDLVTLITCTPLGINSHRIVVTGERVTPTPARDLEASRAKPTVPGFPWWAVVGAVLLAAVLAYLVRSGFVDARHTRTREARNQNPGPNGSPSYVSSVGAQS